MQVKNIRHSGMIVFDLNQALNFYRDFLGMQVIGEGIWEDIKWMKLLIPNTTDTIELYYILDDLRYIAVDNLLDQYNHIAFTIKGIDELYDRVKNWDGVRVVDDAIKEEEKHRILFLRDESNNLLEFVEER